MTFTILPLFFRTSQLILRVKNIQSFGLLPKTNIYIYIYIYIYAQRPHQGLPFLDNRLYIYMLAPPKKTYLLDYTN